MPGRAPCRSRACCTSNRTTFARTRRPSITVLRREAQGSVVELKCTYDPATRGGDAPDGRKVKATIHWVSAAQAVPAEVRLYDRLFVQEDPEDGDGGHGV